MPDDPMILGTMPLDRARELTGACVERHFATLTGQEAKPLPEVSLEELCIANRLVRDNPILRQDGQGTTLAVHCDDRLTAAMYALQHYGSLEDLLAGLGYIINH